MERSEIAAFYRLALELGLLPREAVVAWADRRILAATGETDLRDIDLSLSANRTLDDLLSMLHDRRAQPTPPKTLRMVAALLHRKLQSGELDAPQAANLLYGLQRLDSDAADTLGDELYWIDEVFDGYMMNPDDGPQFVRDFLGRFESVDLPD
jgi:hypothetical protein